LGFDLGFDLGFATGLGLPRFVLSAAQEERDLVKLQRE